MESVSAKYLQIFREKSRALWFPRMSAFEEHFIQAFVEQPQREHHGPMADIVEKDPDVLLFSYVVLASRICLWNKIPGLVPMCPQHLLPVRNRSDNAVAEDHNLGIES